MKKRSIKFEINFTNKLLYTFIFFGAVILLAVGVFAYNSGKPASVFGYSGEEIMVSFNNQEVTLNEALSSFSSGNIHHSSGTIRNGGTVIVPSGYNKAQCSFLVSSVKKTSSAGSYKVDDFVSVEFSEVSEGWKVKVGECSDGNKLIDYGDYNEAYWMLICS